MRWTRERIAFAAAAAALLAAGCAGPGAEDGAAPETVEVERLRSALGGQMARLTAQTDSMDDALRPLPLLTSREEADLQRFPNAEHIRRARSLGVEPLASAEAADSLARTGRLVRLADSTAFWVIRELEHSQPYVTADVPVLLEEIGRRFHERLDGLGVPRIRLEVSSVLRTPDQQADLRTTNPNAARGTSSHEFGTTFDVAYSGYRAPEGWGAVRASGLPELEEHLGVVRVLAVERIAARRSRELKAILGGVLREMQDEGKVLVTLEERQPVYHMTVARRLEGGSR